MNLLRTCLTRVLSRVLVVCMLGSAWPLPVAAEIVPTERAHAAASERSRLEQFLAREDVRARMETLGVSAEGARARIDSLGDEEVRDLAARIDLLPAGGVDALGVLIVVFLVLLVTDLLGYTRIFPFTRR